MYTSIGKESSIRAGFFMRSQTYWWHTNRQPRRVLLILFAFFREKIGCPCIHAPLGGRLTSLYTAQLVSHFPLFQGRPVTSIPSLDMPNGLLSSPSAGALSGNQISDISLFYLLPILSIIYLTRMANSGHSAAQYPQSTQFSRRR